MTCQSHVRAATAADVRAPQRECRKTADRSAVSMTQFSFRAAKHAIKLSCLSTQSPQALQVHIGEGNKFFRRLSTPDGGRRRLYAAHPPFRPRVNWNSARAKVHLCQRMCVCVSVWDLTFRLGSWARRIPCCPQKDSRRSAPKLEKGTCRMTSEKQMVFGDLLWSRHHRPPTLRRARTDANHTCVVGTLRQTDRIRPRRYSSNRGHRI